MSQLEFWCKDNNLSLNVTKTREILVDFRRTQTPYTPPHISVIAMQLQVPESAYQWQFPLDLKHLLLSEGDTTASLL